MRTKSSSVVVTYITRKYMRGDFFSSALAVCMRVCVHLCVVHAQRYFLFY